MTHPFELVTPLELRENERALVAMEQGRERIGTVDDYEWWTRELLPYSALRVTPLGCCPELGDVTVVVKLREHTSPHRRESIRHALLAWLQERAPVNHRVFVHLT